MSERDSARLDLFVRKVLIVFLIAVVAIGLWQVRRVLLLIFIAAILAAGISPAVHRVRIMVRLYTGRKIQRGTAVLFVYIPVLISALLLAFFTLPALLSEMRELATQLPDLIEKKVLTPLDQYVSMTAVREMLQSNPAAGSKPMVMYLRDVARLLASAMVVLVLIVYMLIDGERLRNLFLLFYPAEVRSRKQRMIIRMSRRMSSWLSAQLMLAGIIALATFIGLVLLRVPYPLALAILAGVGEMIPIIGPIVGAIPAVMVAAVRSNWQFWSVLGMAIAIQQLENWFIVPRLMGRKVSISPLAVVIAFLIGGSLLGVIGAVLAVPVAALVQVAFEEAFLVSRERRQGTDRPGTLMKPTE